MASASSLKGLSPESKAKKLREAAKNAEVQGSFTRVKAVLEKHHEVAPDVEKYMVEELHLDVRAIASSAKPKKVAAPKPKPVFRTRSGMETEGADSSKGCDDGEIVMNEITDITPFQKNITQIEHVPVYVVNPAAAAAYMVELGLSADPQPSARTLLLQADINWLTEGVYSLEWENEKVYVQSRLTKSIGEVPFKQPVTEEEFDTLTLHQNHSRYGASVFGLGQDIKVFSILGESSRSLATIGKKRGMFNPNEESEQKPSRRRKGGSSAAEVTNLMLARAAAESPAEKDKDARSSADGTSPASTSKEDSQVSEGPAVAPPAEVDAEDAFVPPPASH